jgi:predicted DCC family thiol-disulfide oxidoreductase YuxK
MCEHSPEVKTNWNETGYCRREVRWPDKTRWRELTVNYYAPRRFHRFVNLYYLIYDDDCAICIAGMKKLKKLDTNDVVRLVPLSKPKLPDGFTLPPVEQLRDELHLIDPTGGVHKGAEAVFYLARILPRTRKYSRILSMPVVGFFARPVYRLVSRNRTKLSSMMHR